ncbi:hypothetical protein F5884DRAFT_320931 [Xylogone sp. PMI_703]|nr:hypothetical protein F5884DRAFT_320931 [Xylogone sp. PMI_703]
MAGFFSRLKGKEGPTKAGKSKKNVQTAMPAAPVKQWEDAWTRKTVDPEEVQELLRGCTIELKSRALDTPFLVLPFRPTSDPSAARSFIRNFFLHPERMHGETLAQELRLTEPMVLCSVVKWCWSRLPSGVVGWESYELFRVGEQDSNMARDAFATFIPLSVDSDARTKIIFDFFDLLSAIAAHGKLNGLGGRKLSRYAGWWAFEHNDTGNGFEGGYKSWSAAADATSHLFFAYLRSLAPDSIKGVNGISTLPISLQKLVQETEYPPETPALMQSSTHKVVMIVETVSPTPFALLRRANHFEYRDDDRALQEFSEYEDPIEALTDECRRVLKSISNANQSQISSVKESTGLRDASWSRFEDLGFSGVLDEADEEDDGGILSKSRSQQQIQGLRSTPRSMNTAMGARPTTPSWADFLSSGFADENKANPPALLLPPDKVLPPIDTRGRSSQSHKPRLESNRDLEPGELASITKIDLDDAFWWVWITSLAGEEPSDRKAAFGRCALVETIIRGGKWLVFEEMVKGAAPEPDPGAYIAEKKTRFGWTRRNKGISRSKSTNGKHALQQNGTVNGKSAAASKTSIGPDQHARIQAAAAKLQERQRALEEQQQQQQNERRGRTEPESLISHKTSSVFTLQPMIVSEASQALKWASKYDKDSIREAYLANTTAGRGVSPNGNVSVQDLNKPVPSVEPRDRKPVPPPATPPAQAQAQASTSASIPITPTPEKPQLSEKAVEAVSPGDIHPLHREAAAAAAVASPPIPPPKQTIEEPRRPATPERVTPSFELSPESKAKHNKLHKEEKKKNPSGLKKMFGRKNRSSKVPENAGEIINGTGNGRAAAMKQPAPPAASFVSETSQSYPASSQASTTGEGSITPVASTHPYERSYEPSFDPSIRDSVSHVGSTETETADARQEFSRFDQGPLEDVPAFVPDSPRASDEMTTPTVSREDLQKEEKGSLAQLKGVSSPAIQDRWAQLRKNAEQRAAQTINQRPGDDHSSRKYSNRTDEDDETSGEETIESRVARIKARVAELTGNMETSSGPAPGAKR